MTKELIFVKVQLEWKYGSFDNLIMKILGIIKVSRNECDHQNVPQVGSIQWQVLVLKMTTDPSTSFVAIFFCDYIPPLGTHSKFPEKSF